MSLIHQIDLSTIIEPETSSITLNAALHKEIAARFRIPSISDIEIEFKLDPKNESWELSGSITATTELQCIQSAVLFEASFHVPFYVILSTHDIEDDYMDIELLEDSKVDIGEIAIQYLALEIPLNPLHPQNTDDTPVNHIEEHTPTWKTALEKLKQNK